jgi:hypothetical protein
MTSLIIKVFKSLFSLVDHYDDSVSLLGLAATTLFFLLLIFGLAFAISFAFKGWAIAQIALVLLGMDVFKYSSGLLKNPKFKEAWKTLKEEWNEK